MSILPRRLHNKDGDKQSANYAWIYQCLRPRRETSAPMRNTRTQNRRLVHIYICLHSLKTLFHGKLFSRETTDPYGSLAGHGRLHQTQVASSWWKFLDGSRGNIEHKTRLTSIQCERLDHCRHDCCLQETEETTGAAASQTERERATCAERGRLGVVSGGLLSIPISSPAAVCREKEKIIHL